MKYHMSMITIILSVMSVSAIADDVGFFGQVRLGYSHTKESTNEVVDTLAAGGKMGYKTRSYRGISVAGTFYTTHQLGSIDDDGLLLSSTKDDYSILGEAYLNAQWGKTSIKVGRQEVDTPFADTDDVGMIPNTFEGLVITNTNIPQTTLVGAHLDRWAGVDADRAEVFNDMNRDKGVDTVGITYEPSGHWNAQAWYYHLKDNNLSSIAYLELGLSPLKSLDLGLQYAVQNHAIGINGRVWGASAKYGIGPFTLSAAHNKVTSGKVVNGFGGGPFFTSSENLTIESDAFNEQKATAVGIEYAVNKLSLGARHVAFSKGEDELDLTASYTWTDKLSSNLIVSDMGEDGQNSRVFLNYNF